MDGAYFQGSESDEISNDGGDGDAALILMLQGVIDTLKCEIRALKSQLESQRVLLEQLQTGALMSQEHMTLQTPARCREPSRVQASAFPEHPLLLAADIGDAQMVGMLLDNGADPHVHGNAALLLASQGGHIEVVEILLDRGADVHVDYDSPLQWACQRGDAAMSMLLASRGATLDALNGCPLRLAVQLGHTDVAQVLIDAGCRI
jgi:hypothetical protein